MNICLCLRSDKYASIMQYAINKLIIDLSSQYYSKHKFDPVNATATVKNYSDNFLVYTGIASKVPNVILQILNLLLATKS